MSQNAAIAPTNGLLDALIIESGVGGGDITVDLRPAAGIRYRVIAAFAHHNDDGGNRTCRWYFTDGTDTIYQPSNDRAANVQEPLYTANNPHLWESTRNRYPGVSVGSVVAGHKVTVWALVEVYKGIPPAE